MSRPQEVVQHPRLAELAAHTAPNQARDDSGRPVIGLVVDACHGCGHEELLTEWDMRCPTCQEVAS